jgi:hypothetical protein
MAAKNDVAGGHLTPVNALGINQEGLAIFINREAEVVADAFAQTQFVGPTQSAGEINFLFVQIIVHGRWPPLSNFAANIALSRRRAYIPVIVTMETRSDGR